MSTDLETYPNLRRGSRKGVPNRLTSSVREAVKIAFDRLGGADGLVKWANRSDRNMTAFYTLCSKLIPTQIEGGDPGRPVVVATSTQLREMSNAELDVLVSAVSRFVDRDEALLEGLTFENGDPAPLPRRKPRVIVDERTY
jgi:hypothetical protein